jgi:uncharacterized membrane protein YfcA
LALELIGLAALGLVVGAFGTLIGAGGGFVLVPLLLILYPDYEPEQITAISLAVVFANATSGSIAYGRQRRVDYLTGLLFAASSVPGVVSGALVVHLVPERLFSGMFGALLLGVAGVALRPRKEAIREPLRGRGILVRHVTDPEGRTYVYAYRVWQGVVLSIGVGFVSSLFGIGGGVIHVPAMIILLHIPVAYAVATSHFVLAFMAGGGSLVHVIDGSLRGDQAVKALALAAGAIPGAQLGALLAHRVNSRVVLFLLGVSLSVLAVRLVLRALFGF